MPPVTTRLLPLRPARWTAPRDDPRRALHLLDVENLTSGCITTVTVTRLWAVYDELVGVTRQDQVIVAVADRNALTTWYTLPPGIRRVVAGSGPDAADRALTACVDITHAAERFTDLVIGSADHHFATLARSARLAGLDVVQVLPGGAFTSARLHRECSRQIRLS